MNFKRTVFVIVALILVVAGLIIYAMNQPDDAGIGDRVFPGLGGVKAEEIDSFELVRTQPKDEKLVFTRDPQTKRWACTVPVSANLETAMVDGVINSIINLKPVPYPQLSNDPAKHGLDKPTVTITLRKGSSQTATLRLGQTTIGGENAVTFVATSAQPNTPLAVPMTKLAGLWKSPENADGDAWMITKGLTDFRTRRLFGHGLNDMQLDTKTIRVKTGTKELTLDKQSTNEWRFRVPADFGDADVGGDREINPERFTGVRPLLNFFSGLVIANNADVIETPGPDDLAKYGLKGDEAMRIELTDTAGKTDTLYVGKVADELTKSRFVRKDGDSCVIKLAFDRYDSLLRTVADPSELRNRDVLSNAIFNKIDGLDFTAGTQSFKVRRFGPADAPKWFLVGGANDPSEANQAVIDRLLQILVAPRFATGFPAKPDETAYAGADLKGKMTVWVGAMAATPYPQTDKPTPEPPLATGAIPTEITLGRSDEKAVRIRKIAGKSAVEFFVPIQLAMMTPKTRLDLLAPGIPYYPPNTVTRMMIERPTGVIEVTKDPKPDFNYPTGKWLFLKPNDRKDKVADPPKTDGLLGLLPALRVQAVVAERPTPDQLKSFGMTPPRMKITVEVANEPTKLRTYEFGVETPDRNFVYARHGAGAVVYTVPKPDVERLLTEDLRDTILYRMDKAKLQKVTLKGWQNRIPVPPAHEYTRAGGTWTCSSPKDATADPKRVDALVDYLVQPRAEKFLGPILPEHRLDPAKGAIEITFTLDGQAPIIVTLGAELDGGLNFAASVSTLPGEAVTLPANVLRVFAGQPDGLLVPKPVVPGEKK